MARQINLRDFQQELAARLREAHGRKEGASRLAVRAGSRYLLLKLEEAGEVLAVPEVAAVPLAHPWFLGLANIRGNLVSVVDFAAFLDEEPTASTPNARLVLLAERFGLNAALQVAAVLGLRNLWQLEPVEGTAEHAWEGAQFRDREGRIWRELSVAALAAHEKFLQAGI